MRQLIAFAVVLLAVGCKQHDKLDIPTAKTRAALSLSAFECSRLAVDQADASRLFNVGLLSGREFLDFADSNQSGYQSIQSQIDPIWAAVAARPSADFKLGEIHAATAARVDAFRGRWDDRTWEVRRGELYREKNCAFVGAKPGPG